ncbi:hypothetical protein REPUB_Repub08aG0169800 [Reevesia pubescens]
MLLDFPFNNIGSTCYREDGKRTPDVLQTCSVIFVTFYSAAVSGNWVFGNKSNSHILKRLMSDDGPSLAPTIVIGLAVVFVLLAWCYIGFIPLDFILPMLLYNLTYKPPISSLTYWINLLIIVAFTGAGIIGSFSSIRKLILDANEFKLFSSDVVD